MNNEPKFVKYEYDNRHDNKTLDITYVAKELTLRQTVRDIFKSISYDPATKKTVWKNEKNEKLELGRIGLYLKNLSGPISPEAIDEIFCQEDRLNQLFEIVCDNEDFFRVEKAVRKTHPFVYVP